jgi:uncharacterized membrane protein YjgN (DUF898 family)
MTAEAAPAQPFAHQGKFFNVLGLALKNAALTVATLTLYRFWARTAMRRRLWSRVWILGDPLEYTGTAGELLRGFFIALPCFFLPAIFVFYIAPFAMDPAGAAWLTVGFYLVAVPLIAAARYWMRRYQLSRTRWRGIRLGLAGSAWSFAFASAGWTVLQTISLGWYTPVARMSRAKLIWSNTRFGDQPFEFVDDGQPMHKGLWWPFALGWFGFPIALTVASLIAAALMAALVAQGVVPTPADGAPPLAVTVAGPILVVVLTLLFMVAAWAPYNAAAMNRIASLLTLDGARFRLKTKTLPLLGVTLAGLLITVLSLGLLAPMGGFLQVRHVLNRLEMTGAPRFADIGQSIVEAPRAGESLGDAFDLDMGVGIV